MSDRGLINAVVNEGTKLEFQNTEIARKNIASARNQLAKRLQADPSLISSRKFDGILGEYLDSLDTKIASEMGIEKALNRGVRDGQSFVGDSARIPSDSAFYGWTPSLPLSAISLAESEMANLIRKTTTELKEKTLRTVQTGLALGADIGDIQNQILGLGIRGLTGRDGVFRSATARAEMQARTVTNDLINRGAMITYGQVDQIVPELEIKKVWQTVGDRRTSPRCISLSGQIKELEELFRAADGWSGSNPPSHPNCRSRVTCTTKRYQEKWESRFKNLNENNNVKPIPVKPVKVAPQPKKVDTGLREFKPDELAFSNPNYDATKFNSAFQNLAKENPALAKRLDALVDFQQKEKVSLLFHDGDFSGKNDELQKQKFYDFLNNRKDINPRHFPSHIYKDPAVQNIWLTTGDSKGLLGFTGDKHSFVMLRTDRLNGKQMEFSNQNIQKSLEKTLNMQKTGRDIDKILNLDEQGFRANLIKNFGFIDGDEGTILLNTYTHEMGHQVQLKAAKINPSVMQAPSKMDYTENISRYGMKDDEERFAEGFTWFILDPDSMKNRSPEYYNWIESVWKIAN